MTLRAHAEGKDTFKQNRFVIKGHICQTVTSAEPDLHEGAYAVCVDGVSKMYFRMVDETCKPPVFSEAFYLATKGGGAFFGQVGSFEEGYGFDAVVMDDSVLPRPRSLSLAERMERAVYLGLDEKNIVAKFVAGKRLF